MKIVKKGRQQRGWSKEYKCTGNGNGGGGCGAVLLVSEYDIYGTSNTDYTGDTNYYDTFCCMQCGVETDVKDVPRNKKKGIRPTEEERREIALKISSETS